ncbi:MAG: glycosyltransferase [Eubacterium sp.]|nr:glycosyltransferase [Eubacterium sp.]
MNILIMDWGAFGKESAIKAFEELGHKVFRFFHKDYLERRSDDFMNAFKSFITDNNIDFCFSFNFYPILAESCKENNLKYISFVYDSPHVNIFSYTVTYPTNYVFLFDSDLCTTFNNGGIKNIYYSPLAADIFTPQKLDPDSVWTKRLYAKVSFVGALYNEDHNFFERLKGISDYTKGYLDGIMKAQLKIYGYNFIEELLTKPIIDDLQKACPYTPSFDGAQTLEYVFANYFIDRKLTELERKDLLSAVAAKFPLNIYTLDIDATIPNAVNLGAVDYYKEMPYVFYNSKINLNISLRSITAGIPLRAMDIMAAGGFLLTNYQPDLLRHFVPGEDFVYFESKKDLLEKIDYYLKHEDERKAIARHGQETIAAHHTYKHRLKEILDFVFEN